MTEEFETSIEERWPRYLIVGALAGLVVWVADYDFFINVGGPSTPISDSICHLLGLEYCCCGMSNMKYPPLVLAVLGAIAGAVIGKLRDRKKDRSSVDS